MLRRNVGGSIEVNWEGSRYDLTELLQQRCLGTPEEDNETHVMIVGSSAEILTLHLPNENQREAFPHELTSRVVQYVMPNMLQCVMPNMQAVCHAQYAAGCHAQYAAVCHAQYADSTVYISLLRLFCSRGLSRQ
jgi:hypothetical protein